MHNNYYFLKLLSKELDRRLSGWTLQASFSQYKDELILEFTDEEEQFYIRSYLQSDFSCLQFPETFHRANRNTANIFEEIIGLKVKNVIQFSNERAFAIALENEYALVFKLFGNRANIILFKNQKNIHLFKNKLNPDRNIEWNNLNRNLSQKKEDFLAADGDIAKLFPTFGKVVMGRLEEMGSSTVDNESRWQKIQTVLQTLENPAHFYVTKINNVPVLSFFPEGQTLFESPDAIAAINHFFVAYTRDYYFEKEKSRLLRQLEQQLQSFENYLKKSSGKLKEIQEGIGSDEIANIIMAYLHQIPSNTSEVNLFNFYTQKDITIKLNPKLSPQKNAENYYRKSKNKKIEIDSLETNIAAKKEAVKDMLAKVDAVKGIMSSKELRQYVKDQHLSKSKPQSEETSLFKSVSLEGYQVYIGKNAKNNDLLTQKHAYKEDLWLHAKDVSGSHVIIKYQSGKNFPKSVIEKAAQLAAYYSQRKTDSLCPVIYTAKKFVRKPKGLPAGAVKVEKENVILVKPESLRSQ